VVKLLLDENLSPRVAIDLRADGHDVAHLRERGRLGTADPEVLELAFGEDRLLVTANVGDFRKLAAAREVHAGIILLLDGGLRRDEQLAAPLTRPMLDPAGPEMSPTGERPRPGATRERHRTPGGEHMRCTSPSVTH